MLAPREPAGRWAQCQGDTRRVKNRVQGERGDARPQCIGPTPRVRAPLWAPSDARCRATPPPNHAAADEKRADGRTPRRHRFGLVEVWGTVVFSRAGSRLRWQLQCPTPRAARGCSIARRVAAQACDARPLPLGHALASGCTPRRRDCWCRRSPPTRRRLPWDPPPTGRPARASLRRPGVRSCLQTRRSRLRATGPCAGLRPQAAHA